MKTCPKQIDSLDVSIFDAIPSQTSSGDRRSLLAVQRATATKHKDFAYLEIGSHLGGSIQPYLLDDRCKRVYSIDPRPSQQPDDRSPGYVARYENNSSKRMIALLKAIGHGDIDKIECIDEDTSNIDPGRVRDSPEIAFIDGEHTKTAVLSDFRFCEHVVSSSGTVLFHDFSIIYPAITEVCRHLNRTHRKYVPLKLEDNVFAIFFDADKIRADPYLSSLHSRNRHFLRRFLLRQRVKRMLPRAVLTVMRFVRDRLDNSAESAPRELTP